MKKGFTLVEMLVVIVIITILAAILFPAFAKAREKGRQTACMNNQRQIALAMTILSQESGDTLPKTDEAWQGISLPVGTLICLTAGKKITNSYGYNANIAGIELSKISDPAIVTLTTDSDREDNIIWVPADISMRHNGKTVMSFVDTHVELTGNALNIIKFTDNSPMSNLVNLALRQNYNNNMIGDNNEEPAFEYDSSSKVLTVITNNEEQELNFSMSLLQTPERWWGFSMDISIYPGYEHSTDLKSEFGHGDFVFTDGMNVLGSINIHSFADNSNKKQNIVTLYIGDSGAPSASKIIYDSSNLFGNLLNKTGNQSVVSFLGAQRNLSFVVSSEGNASFTFGDDMVSGKLSRFNFSALPQFGTKFGGYGVTYKISNASFGQK